MPLSQETHSFHIFVGFPEYKDSVDNYIYLEKNQNFSTKPKHFNVKSQFIY